MPVPFAPWRDRDDDDDDFAEADQAEAEPPRGQVFFEASLNMTSAWYPPRPPQVILLGPRHDDT